MPFELPAEVASTIPPDVLSNPIIQRYNDVGALLKGHLELNEYRGRSVALPGDNDTPEQVEKWKADHLPKLAKVIGDRMPPAKAEDYDFKFDGVTDEQMKSDATIKIFRDNAYKLGLSKTQAAGLAEVFAKEILPSIAAQNKPPDIEFIAGDDVTNLMKETFKDETTARISEYKQGVKVLAQSIPGLEDVLNEGAAPWGKKYVALGDHPAIVQLITEIGRLTGSDFSGTAAGRSDAARAAEEEIQKIMYDKNDSRHELWRKGDPKMRAYMEELHQQVTGGR